jgi:L-ascorbate metabolism protein UlaG (beta-lactamase superfamily)
MAGVPKSSFPRFSKLSFPIKVFPAIRTGVCVLSFVAVFRGGSVSLTAAGLDSQLSRSFVVSDPPSVFGSVAPPMSGVRVTYLGTNGYLLEARDAAILIDPYFSRIGLAAVALNRPIKPDITRIRSGLEHVPSHIDAILVTHGHFDHLLDVPEIARRTGACVIASPTSCHMSQAAGVSASDAISVRAGDSVRRGAVRVHALAAVHDLILGIMPFPGVRTSVPEKAPARPSDWVCGEPLAFLVEIGGKRVYVDSGGTPAALPPMWVGPVDLAILGVSLPDSRKRLVPALRRLRPRYVLPSHQDDFFRPLTDGFRFGSLTDFSAVPRSVEKYKSDSARPTRLVLLDYFAPWTLR